MLVTPWSERVNVISNLPFEHVITMDASLVGCPLDIYPLVENCLILITCLLDSVLNCKESIYASHTWE